MAGIVRIMDIIPVIMGGVADMRYVIIRSVISRNGEIYQSESGAQVNLQEKRAEFQNGLETMVQAVLCIKVAEGNGASRRRIPNLKSVPGKGLFLQARKIKAKKSLQVQKR